MNISKISVLLSMAVTAITTTAQGLQVPPPDLTPGDSYRILFVSDGEHSAVSSDIAVYNAFVTAQANAVPQLGALNASWFAVGSTGTVDARDNTQTNPTPAGPTGVPIYRPDGVRIADHYDHLWNASNTPLHAAPQVTASGVTLTSNAAAFTGSSADGTLRPGNYGLGQNRGGLGSTGSVDGSWMDRDSWSSTTLTHVVLGMSQVLTIPQGHATQRNYGTGCGGALPVTLYAADPTAAADQSIRIRPDGANYEVSGTHTLIAPHASSLLMMRNDEVQSLQLPFVFPYGAGETDTVWLSSNGFLSFVQTADSAPSETVQGFLNGPPRLAFLWDDLDPTLGGNIYAGVDASDPDTYRVTFVDVIAPGAGTNNVQVTLRRDGEIEVVYGQLAINGGLIGFTNALSPNDPGATDWSTLRPTSVYQQAIPPQLSASFGLRWTGTNYGIVAGAGSYVAPTGTATAFRDDETQRIALPWAFPNPQGTTDALWLCSNGWLSFEATSSNRRIDTATRLLANENVLVFCGLDLNPAAAGTVHLEVDPSDPGIFHITFVDVPSFGDPTSLYRVQVSIHQSGDIQVRHDDVATVSLVGYSPGHGATDNGPVELFSNYRRDLGAGATQSFINGVARPVLTSERPVAGVPIMLTLSDLPSNAMSAFLLVGTVRHDPGIDLAILGMPGCDLYVSNILASFALPAQNGMARFSLTIPPAASGAHVYWTGGAVALGSNSLGVLTSNGNHWVMGTL